MERSLVPEDLQITDSRYGVTLSLLQCLRCEFIFAANEETHELTRLYTQLEDRSYEDGAENRSLQMRWLLGKLQKSCPDARTLLDIGAGTGLLVREAVSSGYEAMGIEPSRWLSQIGRQSGLNILNGTLPCLELEGKAFDVVCLIDVIEHVQDPVGLLRSCITLVSANGVLVVVTPDIGSVVARALGKRWWHLRLAHVGYFNKKNMTLALSRSGFQAVDSFRAKWFFPIDYVMDRLAFYLPVGGLVSVLKRFPRIGSRIVVLDTRDSMVIIANRAGG